MQVLELLQYNHQGEGEGGKGKGKGKGNGEGEGQGQGQGEEEKIFSVQGTQIQGKYSLTVKLGNEV